MPKDHAVLSASGSHRWLVCTPSAMLEQQFPPETSSYAEEGTLAHRLGENEAALLLNKIDTDAYIARLEEIRQSPFYNQEMQEHAEHYAGFVLRALTDRQAECPDAFADLEVRLDFSKWVPDGFGTGDCIIVSDGTLEVIDLKYGKGVQVSAEDNSQMMLYALGAYEAYSDLYEIKRVKMTIYQPRLSGIYNSYELSVKNLLTWAKKAVKPAAKLAAAGEGEFRPGFETCRFCRARFQCRARANENTSLFEENDDPLLLTPDEAGEILAKAGDIEAWLKDLKELVSRTLFAGEKVEGWKLVEGRSVRKISDELRAKDALNAAGFDDAILYERKFLTLTELEKTVGKKKLGEILGDLIVKPKGTPTLAQATDKRPEWVREEDILEAFDEADDRG